jgi:HK97 family phage portal protein
VPGGNVLKISDFVNNTAGIETPGEKKTLTETQLLTLLGGGLVSGGDSQYQESVALRSGLESSVWAFAAISLVSNAASSVGWYVEKMIENKATNEDEWTRLKKHDVQNLMERPNPYMSRVDFIYRMTQHLMLTGNAYSWMTKTRRGSKTYIKQLHPVDPDDIEEVASTNRILDKHVVAYYLGSTDDGQDPIKWETNEVFHTLLQDPDRIYKGFAPFAAALRTIETDSSAVDWNKNALDQRTVNDIAITLDTILSDEQFNEVVDQIQNEYGGSKAARRPMVLGAGANVQKLNATPVEMDFTTSRKVNLTEIASAFGVLPALFSPDAATFSNLKEARRALWIDTVIPLLSIIQASINRQIVWPYHGNEFRVMYDLTQVEALKDNLEQRVAAWETMINNGVPLNMASTHLQLGLPRIDGGDEPHGLRPIASQIITTNPQGTQMPRTPENPQPNREPGEPDPAAGVPVENPPPPRAAQRSAVDQLMPILVKALELGEDERVALKTKLLDGLGEIE